MTASFRDKRTREFAEGKRVNAFASFERRAEIRLDQLDAATSLRDLDLPATDSKRSRASVKANSASVSTISGGFASNGPRECRDQSMLKLLITIKRCIMGRSAIHPGEHLAEQLEELDMSAAELARQLKVPTNRITAILNRWCSVTGDTALRLGHFFKTSAEFWMNLQKLYELRLAEEKFEKMIKTLPTLTNLMKKQQDVLPSQQM